ncbi:MAG TPA: DedA family protein [Thermomicrobiaceae bacterium]|nr:DedA family protein [Thermomicrobiaceae bacterium]
MHGIENAAIDFVRSLFNTLSWLGIVLAMAIESACIPLPSEIIMPLAGWLLVAERHLGWPGIIEASVWGAVGNLIGGTIAYGVGAWGGRRLVVRYGRYVLISRHDLDRVDAWFSRRGEITVFVARLLPVVRTFIAFPAGVARMSLWRFLVYTFIGTLIWCIPLTAVGYYLGPRWESFRSHAQYVDDTIAILIVLAVVWYVWHRLRVIRAEDAAAQQVPPGRPQQR